VRVACDVAHDIGDPGPKALRRARGGFGGDYTALSGTTYDIDGGQQFVF
jgi:hypothetical protein